MSCAGEQLAALLDTHERLPIQPHPYQIETLRVIKQRLEIMDDGTGGERPALTAVAGDSKCTAG